MSNYTHAKPSGFERSRERRWSRRERSRLEKAALGAGTATAAAVALTGLARKSYASPITTYRQVVPLAAEYRALTSSNITVNDADPFQKLVLFAYKDRIVSGNPVRTLVGGIDNGYPFAPRDASGHLNVDDLIYWGMLPGEQIDGWFGGIDGGLTGTGPTNGSVGDYNPATSELVFDEGEGITPEMITKFIGNDPFVFYPGIPAQEIDALNIIPEPLTGSLMCLGALGLLARQGISKAGKRIGNFVRKYL